MDELQGARVALHEVDAGDAAVVDLTEELTEVGTALVPHPGIGEELGLVAGLDDTVGEIDILAEAHLREAAQLQIDITPDTHVERTGVELVELGLTASDTACGKERGHRVGDGLLDGSEGRVGGVGAAEGGL